MIATSRGTRMISSDVAVVEARERAARETDQVARAPLKMGGAEHQSIGEQVLLHAISRPVARSALKSRFLYSENSSVKDRHLEPLAITGAE